MKQASVQYTPRPGEQIWEAAFKKPGSGRLYWIGGSFASEKLATSGLQKRMQDPDEGYLLYGGPFLRKEYQTIA